MHKGDKCNSNDFSHALDCEHTAGAGGGGTLLITKANNGELTQSKHYLMLLMLLAGMGGDQGVRDCITFFPREEIVSRSGMDLPRITKLVCLEV